MRTVIFLVVLLSAATEISAHKENIYYVSTFGTGSQCTQSRPCPSLTTALKKAMDGDSIVVGPGAYNGEGNVNVNVTAQISIVGEDAASVIFQCSPSSWGWDVRNISFTLDNIIFSGCEAGLIVSGGSTVKSTNSGATSGANFITALQGSKVIIKDLQLGAITGTPTGATLLNVNQTDLVIKGSKKSYTVIGSVLNAWSSHVIISNMWLHTSSGALLVEMSGNGGSIFLSNVTLSGSKAQALRVTDITEVNLLNCTFTNNSLYSGASQPMGAALFVNAAGSTVRATNCHFDANFFYSSEPSQIYTAYGAAVYLNGVDTTFIDCTFNGNYGPAGGTYSLAYNRYVGYALAGGAIYVYGSALRMQNCDVSGNYVSAYPSNDDDGGGVQQGIGIECGGNAVLTWIGTNVTNNKFSTSYLKKKAGSAINCFSTCTIAATNSNYTAGNESPVVSGQCYGL